MIKYCLIGNRIWLYFSYHNYCQFKYQLNTDILHYKKFIFTDTLIVINCHFRCIFHNCNIILKLFLHHELFFNSTCGASPAVALIKSTKSPQVQTDFISFTPLKYQMSPFYYHYPWQPLTKYWLMMNHVPYQRWFTDHACTVMSNRQLVIIYCMRPYWCFHVSK